MNFRMDITTESDIRNPEPFNASTAPLKSGENPFCVPQEVLPSIPVTGLNSVAMLRTDNPHSSL